MYDTMVVEVCHSRQDGANEISSVTFKVGSFTADAVEEFSSKS
jgi:hypothetical protein